MLTATTDTGPRVWSTDAERVLDPALRGVVRVLGGPGTGKTTLLVSAAAARIAAGADPESVLLITGAGRLDGHRRAQLTSALLAAGPAESGAVVRTPLLRSVHAYAFAVLRLAAQRAGDPPPRLITGAEQDGVIRELLAGDVEDGARHWPAELRAALTTAGFATELRDLMSRCAQRGVDAPALRRLGRLHGRPEWVAAGRFAEQYEQVMLLRAAAGMAAPQATVPAFGAADLVSAALDALAADPELLAGEHARIGTLLVDDAQHLDPQSARLVRVLAAGAGAAVLAGDPNQAVFGFRGADAALLTDTDTPTVLLTTSHRCAPAIATTVSGMAALLPGQAPARQIDSGAAEPGSVTAVLAGSEHEELARIADTLRRAHLVDGVPWAQMAVIVRSVPRAGAALPRALVGAGVPVAAPAVDPALPDNLVVRALLTVLSATASGLTADAAESLVTGPIGRVDPVTLRQLRRALRRADGSTPPLDLGTLLVRAVTEDLPDALAPAHARPLRRIRAVWQAACAAPDPRTALWSAWQRSGLQQRMLSACERGGTVAQRAGQNLHAVTTLCDTAERFFARTPGASVAGLLEHIDGLRLPLPAAESVEPPDAVSIVSPHQALGRQWDVVVIAGLQEGLWPNIIPRGGVLGTQQLTDVLDGVAGTVSARAPLIAEERRLLISAMGRARRALVITAVDGAGADTADLALPSPFFFDIARFATSGDVSAEMAPARRQVPVLSAPAVVGRLRAVVCAPPDAADDDERAAAAAQLARLAAAGVPGADPATWHGLTTVSTEEPLWTSDQVVTMSPSTLQMLSDCPLRWLLERHGGTRPADLRSATGSLIHALVSQSDRSAKQLSAELEKLWPQLPFESGWYAANELDRHIAMLETFLTWRADTRRELTEVGTEVDVDGLLDTAAGSPPVRVRGRIDRLERDAEGRLVIVDVKTGRSPVTKDDAQHHAQLALYQLAVAAGLIADGDQPGGARLVYVAKRSAGGATERHQDALTTEAAADWQAGVEDAAAATAGPQFVARVNDGCTHCPVRSSCPAQRLACGRDLS